MLSSIYILMIRIDTTQHYYERRKEMNNKMLRVVGFGSRDF